MRKWTLIQVFLRCFVAQVAMGMRYMQSFGFAYAIYPGLREVYPEGRKLTEVFRRHLSFFHTHPVFFPCILGCILRGEIESIRGGGDSVQLAATKDVLMGPFSAIGDGFFGAALRPLAAVVGVALAIQGSFWGPAALITIYNVPNLWFRLEGFIQGFRRGVGVLDKVRQWQPTRYMRWMRVTSALVGGAFVASWVHTEASMPLLSGRGLWTALGSLGLAILVQRLLSRGFSAIYILYLVALVVGGIALYTA
ncbi:MAG: PTS system mannose/fructose/sorbose family transporter subunit IID [Deltaproteobacteria bacterium]|nr:PTS system mannose/fructose/sorbose family transporter subunit IID [Deltaproteobacteria bacterium]MBW2305884.1 PTS system mannose/fructose/sorbose family transporter subunit IID [Deltaproteobacteria bacterium]